jgi:hypothetical protein
VDVYSPEFVNAWIALGARAIDNNNDSAPEGAREIIMEYARTKYPTRSHELLRTAPLTGIAPLRSHCARVLVELWRIATAPENPVIGADALDLVRRASNGTEETYAHYFRVHRAPVDLVVARIDPSAPRETVPLTTALLRAMLTKQMVVGEHDVDARIKSYIAYFNLSRELLSSRLSYGEKELRRALMELHQLNMTLDKQKYAAAILSRARHQKPPPGAIVGIPSSEDILSIFSWGVAGAPPLAATTTDEELRALVDQFYAGDTTNMHKLFPLALPSTPEEARAMKAARAYKAAGKDPWARDDALSRPPLARGWIWRPALDPAHGEYVVAFEPAADMTFPPAAERPEAGERRGLEGALVPFVGYPGNWHYGPVIEIPAPEKRCLRTGVLYSETSNHPRAASWRRERLITLPSGDRVWRVVRTRGWFSAESEAPYADGDETIVDCGSEQDQGRILHPRNEDQLIEDAAELWYGPIGSYAGFMPYDPARVIVVGFVASDVYDIETPAGRARSAFFSDIRAGISDYRAVVAAWNIDRKTPVLYSVRGAPPAPKGLMKGDVIKKARPAGGLLLYYYANFFRLLDTEDLSASDLARETRRIIFDYEKDEGGVLVDEAAFLQTLTLGDARFYSRTRYSPWFGREETEKLMDALDVVLQSVIRARAPRTAPTRGATAPERVSASLILQFIEKPRLQTAADYEASSTLTEARRIARAVLAYPDITKTPDERERFIRAARSIEERDAVHIFKLPAGASDVERIKATVASEETGFGGARVGLAAEFGVLVLPIVADAVWYILKDVDTKKPKSETDKRIEEAWGVVKSAKDLLPKMPNAPVTAYARALVEFMREVVYHTLDVRLQRRQREIFRDLGEI